MIAPRLKRNRTEIWNFLLLFKGQETPLLPCWPSEVSLPILPPPDRQGSRGALFKLWRIKIAGAFKLHQKHHKYKIRAG
jgi:hypothetical protein